MTMPTKTKLTDRTRATRSRFAITLLACLGLWAPVHAKKGGGGGGGDPGGGVVENPVPLVVASPVNYDSTELRWPEVGHQGIWLNSINSQGLAVGFVKRPPLEGSPEGTPGERRGVINLDPATREATDTMVDLNVLFSASLAVLNAGRTDGPWRIAYARAFNEAGLIGCQLIPWDAARSYNTSEAAAAGVAPVPTLLAVADLQRAEPDAMIVVDPDNTSPEQELYQMNEHGDVLLWDGERDDLTYIYRVHRLGTDTAGDWIYEELSVPPVNAGTPASFNSSLQFLFYEHSGSTRSRTSRLYQYSLASGDQTLLTESGDPLFSANGIAEDNTAYAHGQSTSGKGNNRVTLSRPYHIISPTERTPLTFSSGWIFNWVRGLSRAATSGEEEVFIQLYDTGEYQVYKPNFGARFVLPIAPRSLGWAGISPPYDAQGVSSAGEYFGGYVAYSTNDAVNRSYVLTPVPITAP